jgi:dTDP-4-dehydrorhamnose reductase
MEAEWSRLRLLITGASGLYGSKLADLAEKNGHQVFSIYSKHQTTFGTPVQLDVSDQKQVETTFAEVAPKVVVHAATLTDVDKCELNKDSAWKINVEGTENITRASKTNNTFLIYVSTDYVFSGEKGDYKETDPPDPINYYGFTKLKAEEKVKSLMDEYCIARASVIYGATPAAGKINFALWVLNNLRRGDKVRVVTDQWNSPTLNTNLANMTLEIIERRLTGTFHLSGATRISRYDFARIIAQAFKADPNLITPATTSEFSWPAKRPRDSSLNTEKAQQMLKNKPLPIDRALQEMKQELATLPNIG